VAIFGIAARHSMADYRHAWSAKIVAGALAAAAGVGGRRPRSG
jgi:hypothetical protein